ncbi:MAG: phage tail tape measure protein, partial [Prevotella sp.]|nr:phage tail tape measure protein [Prevotella sp.]
MAKEQDIITKIFLNDEQAKDKLNSLEKKMEELRKKRDQAFNMGKMDSVKDLNKELIKTKKEMSDIQISGTKINHTLENLSTASVKELRRNITVINNELKSGRVKRGSEDWKALNGQLRKCKEELQRINMESKTAVDGRSFLSKAADFMNRNWGAITQSIAGFATVTQLVRSTINSFADMQQEMANVRKYTGQTAEEIEHMNEVFKQMDTRTSREELNQLAGSAGRLGITAEKDILAFVDAADKINVALGDDLGKGAVDNVGKLAMAFGEDDRMGLRGAMLATGSALNELAQNSSAQAGYLVDFTARLAGVGVQAKMSQAQIMGWGSVLDENMQKEEMAATSLSKIIATMATDSSKMAQVAGLDAKKFADLIKTDMNEALMQFFEAMNKQGGFTALAPMFADMGLDGARATSVLAVLASKINDVRKNQELANNAYQQGTSVIEEFNVQNTTVQAGLDKAKKKFNDLCVELGERLEPIGKYTISTMSMGIKVLNELIKFTTEHWRLLIVLGAVITANTALWYKEMIAIKIKAAATVYAAAVDKAYTATAALLRAALVATQAAWALVTKGVQGYTVVMRAARIASITNPWTALATVLSVVGVAIYGAVKAFISYKEAMRNSTQKAKNAKAVAELQASMAKKVSDATLDERNKIDMLNKVIHSNAYTVNERRQAIAALQKLVPEYHASISKEGTLYNDNQKAIRDYIKELENAALAEAIYERKVEINKKKLDLRQKENRIRGSLKAVKAEREAHPKKYESEAVADGWTGEYIETNEYLKNNLKQEEIHNQRLKDNLSLQKQINAEENFLGKELEKNAALQKKYNDVKKQNLYNGGNNSSVTAGGSAVSSYGASSGGYVSEKQQKKQEQERKKREAALKREQAKEKSAYNSEMKEAKNKQQADINDLRAIYAKGEIIFTEYEQRITQAKVDGIQQRMDIMRKYGFLETEVYDRLQAEKQQVLEESNKKLQDIHNRASIRDLELAQRYAEEKLRVAFNTPGDKMYQDEMALNEALFQNDLDFLRKKQSLYSESSEDFYRTAEQIDELQKNHQLDLQQLSFDRLLELRKQFGTENLDEMQKAAEKELDVLYKKLEAEGEMTREEYDKILQNLKNFYAQKKLTQQQEEADKILNDAIAGTSKSKQSAAADAAYKKARAEAITELDKKNDGKSGLTNYFLSDIKLYQTTKEKLKEMYKGNEAAHDEMCEAIKKAEEDLWNKLPDKLKMVMDAVGSIMNGMSSYYSAAADYEVNVTTKKYDKQIEAAGKNSKKTKKLEEQKEK